MTILFQKFTFYIKITENGTSTGEVGTEGNLVTFGKISSFLAESTLCQTELYFNKEEIKSRNINLKARDLNFMIRKSGWDEVAAYLAARN